MEREKEPAFDALRQRAVENRKGRVATWEQLDHHAAGRDHASGLVEEALDVVEMLEGRARGEHVDLGVQKGG